MASHSQEVKTITEEILLDIADEKRKSVYTKLRDAVLSLGPDITVKPYVKYIAFVRGANFMDIAVYRYQLHIFLNMQKRTLKDPKKLAKDLSHKGRWGMADYHVRLEDSRELADVLSLIRQSYESN